MNDKPKQYKIETLADIISATTPENLDNFLKDLRGVICGLQMVKAAADIHGAADDIDMPTSYIWTDDGEHKIDIGLKAK